MTSHTAQAGTMPVAPDSPSLGVTVSGNVQKYSIKKKKVLNAEEMELFELTQAAGIVIDQEVFKIIVDLLKMNVAPLAVFQTLKAMCAGQKISDTSLGDTSTASHSATAPSESREDPVVSDKSAKKTAPQAPPAGPAARPQRGGAKIVVYGPGDQSAPLSQGPPSPPSPFLAFHSPLYFHCRRHSPHIPILFLPPSISLTRMPAGSFFVFFPSLLSRSQSVSAQSA
ncbi:mitotic-spindle organizing protein 2 isoform X2 [Colossoma macropomum]|uniref:mitotic-spindle organizing protein 2 isoform X2 n=1 Tax=Colossoma macropomum TaxID=42526 RepID=UPI0018647DFA|nr:mitotic-spindle organizing protein 2 isoform X2 [Colossoma macropomum]